MQLLFATQLASGARAERAHSRPRGEHRETACFAAQPPTVRRRYPGLRLGRLYGILAPAGTPREIVTRLNSEIVRVLALPDYRSLLVNNTIDPIGSPPEELARYIKSEIVKWAKVIKDAGVRVD